MKAIQMLIRTYAYALLLLAVSLVWAGSDPPPLADVLGVNHINSHYHLSDQDYLNEGADAVLELGSQVIKLVIRDNLERYYAFNCDWPEIKSLVQAAELPYFKEAFAKPFSTIVLMTFRPGVPLHYFLEGMSPDDVAQESEAYYEFTKYLLNTYRGTGKTFVLQNWEGDWVLTPPPLDMEQAPSPEAVGGMIAWLNARQDGVEKARAEVGMDGVAVYHAAEVNLVEKAQLGYPTVTNDVLPHTRCDLYSYSAYDTMAQSEAKFRAAMEYLAEKAPDSSAFGDKNIYIGEFGWPESLVSESQRIEMVRYTIDTGLELGARYLLFWALYCDGPIGNPEPPLGTDDLRGNWLIRPDGTKSPAWDYLYQRLVTNGGKGNG